MVRYVHWMLAERIEEPLDDAMWISRMLCERLDKSAAMRAGVEYEERTVEAAKVVDAARAEDDS